MPTDKDLFVEEQTMATMSFGEHIEELRVRLILALLGLFVGLVIVFLPPFYLAFAIVRTMQEPAKIALDKFYKERAVVRAAEAEQVKQQSAPMIAEIPGEAIAGQLRDLGVTLPGAEKLQGRNLEVPIRFRQADLIPVVEGTVERSALISLSPLETVTVLLMVGLVSGLVVSSPWVFYQIWAFVAAGLYRHEKRYVARFLPFSLGLFLSGVFLCFFAVLPVTLSFLLEFNVWLGIEPNLRLSEWMGFASVLPLVFGIAFQTPLVMLFLARIGIFTAEDYRSKRKMAILVMVVVAAVLTPGPDVFSQMMLAVPMVALYELGILMVGSAPADPAVEA